MPEKNKTMYAILGVLSLKPGTGYDIKKFCDKTVSHYWNENFGNIYPMLGRLEADGLIEPERGESGQRKKSYRITGKGLQTFQQWLALPVEYRPARSELLLKLSFATLMPKEKRIDMIEAVRAKYAGDLKRYKAIEASYTCDEKAKQHPQYIYWLAPLRYGVEAAEMTVRWCDETVEAIRSIKTEE